MESLTANLVILKTMDDFNELDKLISQEISKYPLCNYNNEEQIDCRSILEGAYSKIALYSETTWWNQEEIDEYRSMSIKKHFYH